MQKESKDTERPESFMVKLGLFFMFTWAVGIIFYHTAEGMSWVDAVYLTSMTLTTVGYGDFVPQTDVGKLFTSVYAFLGVVTFLGFAAALFERALGRFGVKKNNQ